jgi:hypothetical protein
MLVGVYVGESSGRGFLPFHHVGRDRDPLSTQFIEFIDTDHRAGIGIDHELGTADNVQIQLGDFPENREQACPEPVRYPVLVRFRRSLERIEALSDQPGQARSGSLDMGLGALERLIEVGDRHIDPCPALRDAVEMIADNVVDIDSAEYPTPPPPLSSVEPPPPPEDEVLNVASLVTVVPWLLVAARRTW